MIIGRTPGPPERRRSSRLVAEYRWIPAALGAGAVFAPEVSYAGPAELTCSPAAPIWGYPIETVSQSEKEIERTVQRQAVTPRWPVDIGKARIEFVARGRG